MTIESVGRLIDWLVDLNVILGSPNSPFHF